MDKPAPDVEPKIVLTPENYDDTAQAMKSKVGEDATMRLTITDNKNNDQPLAYYYFSLHLDDGVNRKIKPIPHGKPIRCRLLVVRICNRLMLTPMKA